MVTRNLFVVGLTLTAMACSDQSSHVLSTRDLEDEINSGGGFNRGDQRIGESCTTLRECNSLMCVGPSGAGICSQECEAASCPGGSSCTRLTLGVSCSASSQCWGLTECQGRPCSCVGGECEITALCYEKCETTGQGEFSCNSTRTACSQFPTTDLCVPRDLNGVGSGTARVGEACPTGDECDGTTQGLACYGASGFGAAGLSGIVDGYCSRTCRPGQCPLGSTCLQAPGSDLGTCYKLCVAEESCQTSGTSCVSMGTQSICIETGAAPPILLREDFNSVGAGTASLLTTLINDRGWTTALLLGDPSNAEWEVGVFVADGWEDFLFTFDGSNLLWADTIESTRVVRQIIATPLITVPPQGMLLEYESYVFEPIGIDFGSQTVDLVGCWGAGNNCEPETIYTLGTTVEESEGVNNVSITFGDDFGGEILRIGFSYDGSNSGWWMIDNVTVTPLSSY